MSGQTIRTSEKKKAAAWIYTFENRKSGYTGTDIKRVSRSESLAKHYNFIAFGLICFNIDWWFSSDETSSFLSGHLASLRFWINERKYYVLHSCVYNQSSLWFTLLESSPSVQTLWPGKDIQQAHVSIAVQIPRHHYGYRLCWCNSCLLSCLPSLSGIQR